MHLLRWPIAAGLVAHLLGCHAPPPGGDVVPLFDAEHAPDILTERRELERPPSTGGNRFLTGWRGQRRARKRELFAQAEARLEIVQLASRPRELVLRCRRPPPGARVAIRVAGRSLGRFELAGSTKIPLPADLPLGRVAIDLTFPADAQITVSEAALRPVLPAGRVELDDGDVVQSGHSIVDIVRRVPAGATLAGAFVPPRRATGQSFSLALEDERGWRTVFEWEDGLLSRLVGSRRLRVPLSGREGLVRVRLAAHGEGERGRWEQLHLEHPSTLGAIGASSPPARPEVVILYVLDALRADALSHLGGGDGVTPNLDRLAAEGVTFTRHWSVAPNTLPSTKALFTGQAFRQRGFDKLSEEPATLAEVFSLAGYRTGAFAGNAYVSPAFGTLRGFVRNGREWIDRGPGGGYNDNAERVQRAALRWLDEVGPDRRVFVYLHTVNPHTPYSPPDELEERFAAVAGSSIDGSSDTLRSVQYRRIQTSAADETRLRGLYAASVAYNDAEIGRLVAELGQRYPPGDVLLVVTADHGEELFDHDGVLHGYTLYDEQLSIPLLFWWPTVLSPARIATATDNLDLHETLRDLAGAPPSGGGQGRSLWPLIRGGEAVAKDIVFAAAASVDGGIYMARSARMKLVLAPRRGVSWGLGEGRGRSRDPEYLFDLVGDPGETANRAGDDSLEAAWLRGRLLAWIERGLEMERDAPAAEAEIDAEIEANLRALGYVD